MNRRGFLAGLVATVAASRLFGAESPVAAAAVKPKAAVEYPAMYGYLGTIWLNEDVFGNLVYCVSESVDLRAPDGTVWYSADEIGRYQ